ncbi:MAG: acetyl-CoA C-acetyltransferase [Aureispira sp.]|nr:acetyl-CoA C-acetyltransferase [Aureispira sp.]
MQEAYIFDAVRTPCGRGKVYGSLHEVKPIDLLCKMLHALQERNSLDTKEVDDIIVGCATPVGEQGGNIAKSAGLYAGWPETVPGMQINRFCASGLESINLAAMKVRSGWEQLLVAGGVESMSRVPMRSDGGALYNDPAVNSKVNYIPQGVSADLISTIEQFDRTQIDQYALQSQQRAFHAQEAGYFDRSIIPVYDINGLTILDKDEHLRPESTLEVLGQLPPAFAALGKQGFDAMAIIRYPFLNEIEHVHTAGNSSGIVDGAGLVLIGNKEKGEALGLKPRARILAAAASSSETTIMLQGTIPSTKKALKLAGLEAKDINLWEVNEAFAAPVLKFQRTFDIDNDILNVNGGAIAMGHPLGATGTMLLSTLIDELERRQLSIGLATMCTSGGMGVTTIVELV